MRKPRFITAMFLIWVALLAPVGSAKAQEEEVEASPLEIEETQEAARYFVSRMLQTRDVGALFDELFLTDFTSHFVSEDGIYPALYLRLTPAERQRLFAVTYNLHYLSAVALISDHDDLDILFEERKSNPRLLLPRPILLKLRRALSLRGDDETQAKSYSQLLAFLPEMERALAKARGYLERLGVEQTSEFQMEIAPGDKLGRGVDYRVRAYIGGQHVKDCEPLMGFPENQKFFRVELPLYIGAIFVRDGTGMKIVRLTYVDGD